MVKKILALHGLGQCGEYFSSKTKGLRGELEKLGYEVVYATAPNSYSPADIADELGGIVTVENANKDVLSWIEIVPKNKSYEIPKASFDYLRAFIVENGPFEGLIGFSQGAALAGYMMTDFNQLLGLTEEQQPPFKFFMAFSGLRLWPERYQKQYDDHAICIPSLHVQGELDTVTEPFKIEALYNSCTPETRTLIKHSGGHYVPNSRGFCKKVIEWLQTIE